MDEPLPIPRPLAQVGAASLINCARISLNLTMPPLYQGWMRKRSDPSTGWKRRYFVLFPDFDYGGITLFYYVNQLVDVHVLDCYSANCFGLQMAQKMIDKGTQTQQGYLRVSTIADIYLVEDLQQRWVFTPANRILHPLTNT